MKEKIWKWLEHNRFTVIVPLVGLVLWGIAVGCTPEVQSPLTGQMVNAAELQLDYDITIKKFEAAKVDLEQQAEQQAAFKEALLALASGSVADWGGLLQLLIGGGFVGLIADNARKSGVIGGLKSNNNK